MITYLLQTGVPGSWQKPRFIFTPLTTYLSELQSIYGPFITDLATKYQQNIQVGWWIPARLLNHLWKTRKGQIRYSFTPPQSSPPVFLKWFLGIWTTIAFKLRRSLLLAGGYSTSSQWWNSQLGLCRSLTCVPLEVDDQNMAPFVRITFDTSLRIFQSDPKNCKVFQMGLYHAGRWQKSLGPGASYAWDQRLASAASKCA